MRLRNTLVGALVAVLATVAVPAAASAATVWVAKTPASPTPPGTSCTIPGYSTIASAIAASAAGTTISICSGTYEEQLEVQKPLTLKSAGAGVVVKLPASPVNSNTPCDTMIPGSYQPNQDLVAICTPGTVTISGIKFEALWPAGTCYDSLYGLFVGGGATLKMSYSTVSDTGNPPPDPNSGCQGGVGIELGSLRTSPAEVAHGVLSNDQVTNYQKNGINVVGTGSTAKITSTLVRGAGATPHLAQNGIEVWEAQATISGSHVSGNECDHPVCGADPIADTQSGGVLLIDPAPGTTVTKSTISENDMGVYYADEQASAPLAPQASITSNQLGGNRYEGVLLEAGWATVNNDTFNGGTVGIGLLQAAWQTQGYGVKGTASGDKMSGLSSYAVEGFSDNAGGPAGEYTITNSKISGNPSGSGVTGSVFSQSPTLNIYTSPTDK